ncbi:MAG: AbrB/MazE/SpoVT family DNA-binding domain-containing protein [Desulfobacterales bacterium]|nr:AbrB/MazE/SpoVT family DNA-binding domain-containing protein [Desulfobacterales bacterium]
MYAKISKKGQVTVPKTIRLHLNIENEGGIMFLVEGDEIRLKGVPGVSSNRLAGSLKKYAKKYVPLNKVRKEIKGKVANEAATEGLSD